MIPNFFTKKMTHCTHWYTMLHTIVLYATRLKVNFQESVQLTLRCMNHHLIRLTGFTACISPHIKFLRGFELLHSEKMLYYARNLIVIHVGLVCLELLLKDISTARTTLRTKYWETNGGLSSHHRTMKTFTTPKPRGR